MCEPEICAYIYHYSSIETHIISHYQYLGVLLLTGLLYLLLKRNNKQCIYVKIIHIIAILFNLGYLIFGLFIYRELTIQLSLAGSSMSKYTDINLVNTYITEQSWLGVIILIMLIILFFIHSRRIND